MSRYGLARYTGLGGAALLATCAYFGGALPALHPDVSPITMWRGPHEPLIYLLWLTGTSLLVWAWWVVRDSAPSARWAAITAALWSTPLLVAPPLGSRDVYSYACEIPEGQAVWLGLASPLVVIHQISGAHNDALMVGLLVAGLALVASSPGRTLTLVGGGALLGLAGTVKATAWVAVPFAALTAIAGPYCLRSLIRCGGLMIGGLLIALTAVMLAGLQRTQKTRPRLGRWRWCRGIGR